MTFVAIHFLQREERREMIQLIIKIIIESKSINIAVISLFSATYYQHHNSFKLILLYYSTTYITENYF